MSKITQIGLDIIRFGDSGFRVDDIYCCVYRLKVGQVLIKTLPKSC